MNSDSHMLNWLEAHPEFVIRYRKHRWSCVPFATNQPYSTYESLRVAVSAAMRGEWNE